MGGWVDGWMYGRTDVRTDGWLGVKREQVWGRATGKQLRTNKRKHAKGNLLYDYLVRTRMLRSLLFLYRFTQKPIARSKKAVGEVRPLSRLETLLRLLNPA